MKITKKKKKVKSFDGGGSAEGGVTGVNTGNGGGSGNGSKLTPSTSKFGWSLVGEAADAISGLFPEPDGYSGKEGVLLSGLDSAYSQASDIMMKINPVFGGIMKAGSFANKGLQALGVGTDGQTKADAILGSDFMALTPFGLINSLGAKKADTMEMDKETLAMGGNSYGGVESTVSDAAEHSGKKYGFFSRKQMRQANDEMASAGRLQNNMATIMNDNRMMMLSIANQQDMNNLQYMNMVNGFDFSNMPMSAKKGGILPNAYQLAHRVAYNHRKQEALREAQLASDYVPVMPSVDDFVPVMGDIDFFQNGGLMSLLPEGALHKDKHHIEEVRDDLKGEITHKGIPVITIAKDGKKAELVAEIEHSEWILSADLTDKIEKLRDEYNDSDDKDEKYELAVEAGQLLAEEIMENTDDRVGLIKKTKV